MGFNAQLGDFSPATSPELSEQDQEFLERLSTLSPDDIRHGEEAKDRCHEIGQEIFATYKNSGNSLDGKAALERVFSALSFVPEAEKLRFAVGYAWAGIGDAAVRWTPLRWIR